MKFSQTLTLCQSNNKTIQFTAYRSSVIDERSLRRIDRRCGCVTLVKIRGPWEKQLKLYIQYISINCRKFNNYSSFTYEIYAVGTRKKNRCVLLCSASNLQKNHGKIFSFSFFLFLSLSLFFLETFQYDKRGPSYIYLYVSANRKIR